MDTKEHLQSLVQVLIEMNLSNANSIKSLVQDIQPRRKHSSTTQHDIDRLNTLLQQRFLLIDALLTQLQQKAMSGINSSLYTLATPTTASSAGFQLPNHDEHKADRTQPSIKPTTLLMQNQNTFKSELTELILVSLRVCQKLNINQEEIVNTAVKQLLTESKTCANPTECTNQTASKNQRKTQTTFIPLRLFTHSVGFTASGNFSFQKTL